ncbi:MAG TPA: MFS transporter [Vicinamibacteria bacterium]|nr:MFS transporter [Vicinamibacteria bacterium]
MSLVDSLRRGYSRTFWVANVLELFERFAYYSSKAVLFVYLADHIGLGPVAAGFLAGSVFNTLLYLLPVLAGTVVDRYGFKRSLMACFGIFSVGYFLIGLGGLPLSQPLVQAVGVRTWMLLALVVTAIGGSLIKPSIVGTVARTTTEDTKALGYSIYYTLVNIGGAVGPLLAPLVRENLGISYVLVVSSLTSLILFACTTLFYREPPRPADAPVPRSMVKVLADMLLVFRNLRFILFLVIFSGFWAMFWHVFYALPSYVKDFLKFGRFEWVETVDAIAIIVVTIPATAVAKRLKPLSAMVLGFALATGCWFIMGSVPTLAGAVAALILYAVGEGIQSPRFYEYVSNLAPPEQVGTYMGFAFLPIAIGTFIAGVSSGYLVKHYVEGGNPAAPQMWFVVGSYGVVSTILMVVYDRFIAPKRA